MKSPRRNLLNPGTIARVLVFLLGSASCAWAEDDDIAPFRMTNVDGYLSVSYMNDELKSDGSGIASSSTITREELFINTHSYVYHPNLLKIDFGAGPVWVQNQVTSGSISNSDNASLYNLSGKLMFLEEKPYTLTAFYDHLNPVFSTSVGQSFTQTTTKYGSNLTLREPFSPFLFILDNSTQTSDGQGLTWISKDETTQTTARIYKSMSAGDHIQMAYQTVHQDTASGNPSLSITPTTIDSQNATLDSRFLFGDKRQITNTNTIIANNQSYTQTTGYNEHKDLSVTPDVLWQHSDKVTSVYHYNFYSSTDRNIDTIRQSGRAGLNIQLDKDIFISGDLHGDNLDTYGLKQDSHGADLRMKYSYPLGTDQALQIGANATYDTRERFAPVGLASNIEQMLLADTNPVSLSREFIDISTIYVRSADTNQLFCPDAPPFPAGCSATTATMADYRIIVIGSITQIQRLAATGNISPTQLLRIEYSFQTGGDAKYTALNRGFQANLNLSRTFSLFMNYRQIDYDLIYGAPTIPLNPARNRQYGARFDQPLEQGYTVGGEVVAEQQDEEIVPYTRDSYNIYLQTPVYMHSSLRISTRHVWMDYLKSTEDVNLAGWSARLNTGPWANAVLTAEYSREQDDGGTLPRSRDQLTLGANWNFRELSMRGEGLHSKDTQGSFQREYSLLRILLTRRF